MKLKETLKKNIKYIIIFIIIAVVYIIVAVLANGKTPIKNSSGEYLIIGDTLILQNKDRKWIQLTEIPENLLNKEYTVYSGDKTIPNVKLQHVSDQWYFINNKYETINVEDFKGASNKENIEFANYELQYFNEEDDDSLNEALSLNSFKPDYNFKQNTRCVEFDFDNNDENEKICTTTNISLSEAVEKTVAIMYMVSNDGVKIIGKNSDDPYRIYSIVDIDNDGTYEMIVTKGAIDITRFDTCYQIYKYKNNKWQLIKDCDINE